MAPFREPAARRGRRLLAAMAAAACLVSVTAVIDGSSAARADPGPSAAVPIKKASPSLPTPSPTDSPSSTCIFGPDFCPPSPSPTPSLVVVSPVPPDPSPSHTIPSYLQGINPSPTPTQQTTDSISSSVPLAGGFVDQLPSPSDTATGTSPNDLAPHTSGLPLPFLAVGGLLILAALGSLIYAITPRNKPIFEARRPPVQSPPVRLTPYGPEGPGPSGRK